jgi:hypothetical protein
MRLIKSFSPDFNHDLLGQPASPGLYSQARVADHLDWHRQMGVNTIYSFCVSHNGYAWYSSHIAPVTPGLSSNFLDDLAKAAHTHGLEVHGYFCLASNPRYERDHADEAVPLQQARNIRQCLPLGMRYIDHFCRCVEEVLRVTEIDGFLLDWFVEIEPTWVPVEREMYPELMGEAFPADADVPEDLVLEFRRRAIARAWDKIRDAAKSVRDNIAILLNVPIRPQVYPIYDGLNVMAECDWFLNESPELENADWIASQVTGKPVLQNLTGWPGHDPNCWKQAVVRGYHLFGYTKCDEVTTLPPVGNEHLDVIRTIYGSLPNQHEAAIEIAEQTT